ncbi:hypothetical protein PVAP13_7KG083018 [Panicum virgatum]|uniref:Uncharacterized protein n=1 Tax=Panicum virgatum TaxID=38727 RepID=A0A8T0QBN4_PANVG|nr:hypothetical protein PVAP13_7KG083018 [Panicum virgatum]
MAPPKLVELEHDKELRELVSSWDFDAGKRFQDKVLSSLNSSVHHPSSTPRGSFSLLAVFQRFTFKLTVETQVGFMVCNLKRFITDHFDVYFHLWRDGGDS